MHRETTSSRSWPTSRTSWPGTLTSGRYAASGAGPVTSGTEWEATYRGLGPMRVRLDAYEPTQQLAFSTTGKRMDMRFSFHFRPVDDGAFTEITVDLDVQPKGLTKLAGPFLRPVMRRTIA